MTEPNDHQQARARIQSRYRMDEQACLRPLLAAARLDTQSSDAVQRAARRLAEQARAAHTEQGGVSAFMREYDLSSEEGVLLMCLAEALLRIPDAATAERLIRDRLAQGHWDDHLGKSGSLFVNASTWGLLLTGRLVSLSAADDAGPWQLLQRLVARSGEAVVRLALNQAMAMLAQQFVLGRNMEEAMARAATQADSRYSFDCLGEAARTQADAQRYAQAYADAITQLATVSRGQPNAGHGISVKLSALHPRYEYGQRARVLAELTPLLRELVLQARAANVALTLDAEEADRLELSLDLFAQVFADPALAGWSGFGMAVQAYQKRALAVLHWLQGLAEAAGRCIPVRLVKGAYWDTEIKRAQERGLDGYPVFTRKAATDVSYLACARFILDHPRTLFGQFATHNAHTLAYLQRVGAGKHFELQRLHGMGETLYAALPAPPDIPCRIYAPVGSHEELLPYLVRRLLENGANTSFVNQLGDESQDIASLVADPVAKLQAMDCMPNARIPLPVDLYAPERRNARGWDLSDPQALAALQQDIDKALAQVWQAGPLIGATMMSGTPRPVCDPSDGRRTVGTVVEADAAMVTQAMELAHAAAIQWNGRGGVERAGILEAAADALESEAASLLALVIREGGRSLADAVAELREAVDYCRYYAARARVEFGAPSVLPGPTGERNELSLQGRGVFACISPWNFPLAIFTGQVAAALAAGNAVLAKPARQTPLVAAQVVALLHRAGVPPEVLHLLPGSGTLLGAALLADMRLAGVAFTGSTETAWAIQEGLARRRGPIVPLIAETGGQNVMIADSSALPEQLVGDVLQSSFNSAGQRCSALRVLFLQQEIFARVAEMMGGAMAELRVGDPLRLDTDVGPVIDAAAKEQLQAHVLRMEREAQLLVRVDPPAHAQAGHYFAPTLVQLEHMGQLDQEVFGPILHLIPFAGDELDAVIDQINASGYGLTLGVHSRIAATWERVRRRAQVGNLYINRNMIGAVVGVQPFGGEGLSGTGPKAGGPYYLHRFATERTLSVNTAALGGNASLLSLGDDPTDD